MFGKTYHVASRVVLNSTRSGEGRGIVERPYMAADFYSALATYDVSQGLACG